MAWIYLAESEGSQRLWTHGSQQLPTVKETPQLNKCFFQECSVESCLALQYGQMSLLSEDQCFPRLTSSVADFHARILALLDFAKVYRASEAGFFGKLSGLPKKQKRQLFFSKTYGQELGSTFQPSEMRLRELDIKSGTVSLRLEMLELHTKEPAGSPLLPTPTASRAGYQQGGAKGRKGPKRYSLESLWKMGKLPTPMARDYKDLCGKEHGRHSVSLPIYWKATHGTTMPASFCEWIMGYRIGATVLEPLVTQSFHNRQEKHSKGLAA